MHGGAVAAKSRVTGGIPMISADNLEDRAADVMMDAARAVGSTLGTVAAGVTPSITPVRQFEHAASEARKTASAVVKRASSMAKSAGRAARRATRSVRSASRTAQRRA